MFQQHLLTFEDVLVLLLLIGSGCEQGDSTKPEVRQKKSWGSSRYSGAEEAWVCQNFYSRISEDLASVEYTVPTSLLASVSFVFNSEGFATT